MSYDLVTFRPIECRHNVDAMLQRINYSAKVQQVATFWG